MRPYVPLKGNDVIQIKSGDVVKNIFLVSFLMCFLVWVDTASAIPTLQLGAPGGPGEGDYADYVDNSFEEDTAYTSGSTFTLYAAGAYKGEDDPILIGGKSDLSALDWSDFGFDVNYEKNTTIT